MGGDTQEDQEAAAAVHPGARVWREQLTKARYIATYRAALHILMRNWESGGKPFTLSNGALALEGVKRSAKWRALQDLEQLGLITIERRKRKSPRITALHTTASPGSACLTDG